MTKQKPQKVKPAEAMKVLANEVQQIRVILNGLMQEQINTSNRLKDVATVFDTYIHYKGDNEEFIKHLDKLIEDQKAEEEAKNEAEGNEPIDGEDSTADIEDEGLGAEGVRT